MKTTISHKNITWISLESPSVKEVNDLRQEYPLPPLVAEELTSLTMRPKVDTYPDILYLVLHFPPVNSGFNTNGGCEIDLVIGKNFLITSHYSPFPPLERLIKNAQTKTEIKDKLFQTHAGFLAFKILKHLYEFSEQELDQLYLKINRLEQNLFKQDGEKLVKEISFLKKDVLDFRRALLPHETVLASFEQRGKEFFNKDFGHHLNLLCGEYVKAKNSIDNAKEILETIHATNESILTTKTNEIMKILAIMAFITFPLMLVSSVFGMNTLFTPIVGQRYDFWIIVAIMIVSTISMFLFFKKKKWL